MNLSEYIQPAGIATKLDAKDKFDLLAQVADLMDKGGLLEGQPLDKKQVLDALTNREEIQSTDLGNGLAMPHARIAGFKGMAISIVTLKEPIAFNGPNTPPVGLICTILVAEDEPTLALQAYSKILELMQDEAIRAYFTSVDDPKQINDYIGQRRISVGGSLTARDIMRPPTTHILPDTPLREVVHQMRTNRIEAVAVEDTDRHVIGEITCDRLFQFGIPDFFNQLQSVGFISRFDPFEKYFSEEAKATAQDVMQDNFAIVPPDATMMEVVFALTVERHPKAYVVDEGKRIGTIDRIEVLDRILDF